MLSGSPWYDWLWGSGLGGFEAVFKQVQSPTLSNWYDHAHNDLLQWCLETGLIGLLLLGVVLAALWRRRRLDALRAPLYAGLSAIAFMALGDFSLHMAGTQLIVATYVGILLRPASRSVRRAPPAMEDRDAADVTR
jgi:O-antigen ligase